MNNSQFRKLVLDTPARQNDASATPGRVAAAALGTKKTSFVPMTPRNVKGGIDVEFARQVRERNAALRPTKKFKSYTPKGVKYAAGYTDRAKAREDAQEDADSKAARIQALEEQMKLGQIPLETFEALREQITGGDVSSTHLVKGLDRKLLERVRRGEDVLGTGGDSTSAEAPPCVDEELDKLEQMDVKTVKHDKAEKKGSMGPPPSMAGQKRSRDEILAELKAERQASAARAKASSTLDGRWRKIGEKETTRIEVDQKGREVLIMVDEDGIVKKKVRKVQEKAAADAPDASKPVLGADVVVPKQAEAAAPDDDNDDDIFEGVGVQYNPLGEEDDDDDDDNDDDEQEIDDKGQPTNGIATSKSDTASESISTPTKAPNDETQPTKVAVPRRTYFNDPKDLPPEPSKSHLEGVQHVLKKAARLDSLRLGADGDARDGESEDEHQARLKKRTQMLAQNDRDLDDTDMGFGSSRLEDEEDGGEGEKIRLAEWKGGAGDKDAGWEEDGKGGIKRKRKPKKRKGDVNNAADILRVIENRKTAGQS